MKKNQKTLISRTEKERYIVSISDPILIKKMKEIAKQENKTLSAVNEELIKEYFENRQK